MKNKQQVQTQRAVERGVQEGSGVLEAACFPHNVDHVQVGYLCISVLCERADRWSCLPSLPIICILYKDRTESNFHALDHEISSTRRCCWFHICSHYITYHSMCQIGQAVLLCCGYRCVVVIMSSCYRVTYCYYSAY